MKNLELKAHCPDIGNTALILASLGIDKVWVHRQIDTYLKISDGKLKFREVDGEAAELIYYQRPDERGTKISVYSLFRADAGGDLKNVLGLALRIDLVVEKTRTLYLWENVRIHLDRVVGLGDFIEFEAVLGETADMVESENRISILRQKLQINDENLIGKGYYELLKLREASS